MNIIHRPISWEDPRGVIRDIFPSGSPDCVTLITTTRGSVRGNHYHRFSSQYAFVVSGRMLAFARPENSCQIARREMGPGDMVLHEPNEAHAYLALEDMIFLAFAEGLRKGEDYEKDTYRVPPLFDPDVELAAADADRQVARSRREDRPVICSVLIPSRGRPDRLRKTLRSIRETSLAVGVEILVRLDDDDQSSLAAIADLTREYDIGVQIGPRRRGYASLGEFYAELATFARGTWIWIMNDDAYVTGPMTETGQSWDAQLLTIPRTGVIVQPECYQLNQSKYWSSEGGAFPLVPNGCWSSVGAEFYGNASVDTWLDQLLREKNGWRTQFLAGIAVVHERDPEDVLEEHRQSAQLTPASER